MYIIILDKKEGTKNLNVKDFQLSTLYKKAGFKSEKGFQKQREFVLRNFSMVIEVYGKTTGKSDTENLDEIFQIPQLNEQGIPKPPIYGNAIVLAKKIDTEEYISVTLKDWEEKKKHILQYPDGMEKEEKEKEEEEEEEEESSSEEEEEETEMEEDEDEDEVILEQEPEEDEYENDYKEEEEDDVDTIEKKVVEKNFKLNIEKELTFEDYII